MAVWLWLRLSTYFLLCLQNVDCLPLCGRPQSKCSQVSSSFIVDPQCIGSICMSKLIWVDFKINYCDAVKETRSLQNFTALDLKQGSCSLSQQLKVGPSYSCSQNGLVHIVLLVMLALDRNAGSNL